MIYLTILLIFIYFKIARVHKKEEKLTPYWISQHIIFLFATIAMYGYSFTHLSWYSVLISSFLSLIIASMLITAVQVGIFVQGKPLFGLKHIYKNNIYLLLIIVVLTIVLNSVK